MARLWASQSAEPCSLGPLVASLVVAVLVPAHLQVLALQASSLPQLISLPSLWLVTTLVCWRLCELAGLEQGHQLVSPAPSQLLVASQPPSLGLVYSCEQCRRKTSLACFEKTGSETLSCLLLRELHWHPNLVADCCLLHHRISWACFDPEISSTMAKREKELELELQLQGELGAPAMTCGAFA